MPRGRPKSARKPKTAKRQTSKSLGLPIARHVKGTRQVTSIPVIPDSGRFEGSRVYRKSGGIHKIDLKRDAKRKAKQVRKVGQPSYRGDLRGKRV